MMDPSPTVIRLEATTARSKLHLGVLRLVARTGRIRRASIALGYAFGSSKVTVELCSGSTLDITLDDPYWSRLVAGNEYEPEVRWALDQLVEPDMCFIDCGANIGYWSSLVSPRVSTIAVEPNPEILPILEAHGRRNGFTTIAAAVWSNDREELKFSWSPKRHGAGGIGNQGTCHHTVTTITLDRVYREHGEERVPIAKVDVEGAEIAALSAASEVLRRGWIIYEDHGRSRDHAVTRWLLESGAEVYSLHVDRMERVNGVRELDGLKTDPHRGYNFIARRPR